ncbi:MAG: hypothetical protein WBC93_04450 [Sulfitobacter sp.]
MTTQHDFTAKGKARLDKWDAQIAEAEARMERAEADARLEIQKQLDDMRNARNEAQKRLQELQATGEAAWGDVRKGAERAWTQLEKSFETAAARFA